MAVLIHSRKHVEVRSYFLYVTPTFLYYYFFIIIFFLNVAGSSSRSLQAELPPWDDCH